MKPNLTLRTLAVALILFSSCAHKYYTTSYFEQKTRTHRNIAILPAEMIFTGTQPKDLQAEDIARIEETESRTFQNALFDGILRYANTRNYFTDVNIQDINTTERLLNAQGISVRDSWKEDDKKLASILGVDAVVRMRIQKKRYMSDLASMGVSYGTQVLSQIGAKSNFPVPYIPNTTNDIYASCNVVCDNQTLWNDHYQRGASYATPSEQVINDIADNFGRHFPYRKRR